MKWRVERLHETMRDENGCRMPVSVREIDADSWYEARVAFVKADVDPTIDPMTPLIRCTKHIRKRYGV